MSEGKQEKGRLWVLAAGIGVMGALYGWFVYAGQIETEVQKVAQSIADGSPTTIKDPVTGTEITLPGKGYPLDPSAIKMLGEVRSSVEAQQNAAIKGGMYNGSEMSPEDTMIARHFSGNCLPGSEEGNCAQDPLFVFGDTKVSSILSGSGFDSARAKAAQDFFDNLFTSPSGSDVTNFQANAPLDVQKITNDPKLKASFTKALSDETVLSIIRQPFSEMIAKRTLSADDEKGISEMQLMERNAVKRFMSSAWAQNVVKLQPQELQQELAMMQAYQNWLEYQSYRQTERLEALLATLVLQNYRAAKSAEVQFDKASSVSLPGGGEPAPTE